MKDWEKELKRYQLAPPPPKMTLQAYILKYLESGDETYFRWFLHTVEPMLNQTASAMVQHYAMYGFFPDLKQACVEGILKALQAYAPDKGPPFWWYARQYHIPEAIHDFIRLARPGFTVQSKDEYDTPMYGFFPDLKQACVEGILKALQAYAPDKGPPFWWYARQYHIPEAIHDFIRLARPGFTVQSKDEYDTLRKVMWMYQDFKNEDADPIKKIAEKTGISEKRVEEYLQSGMRNMSFFSMEMQQHGDEEEEPSYIPAPDYSTDPARLAMRRARQEALFGAFESLSYREQDIVASHLGFCPKCLSTKNADGSYRQHEYFEDLAIPYGLTPKAASQVYDRAIEKLREALQPWKYFGEEDQLISSSVV